MRAGLMPLLAAWRLQPIARQPWMQLLIGAALLLPSLSTAILGQPAAARAVLIGTLLVGLLGLWGLLVAGLLLQNHPHAARLVPGQLRRLRSCLRIALPLLAGLGWLLAAQLLGPSPSWLLIATLALVVLACCLRWPWLWLVLALPPLWEQSTLRGGLEQALDLYRLQPLPATMLTLLLATALLPPLLLQGGGEGHERSHQRRQRRSMVQAEALGQAVRHQDALTLWIAYQFGGFYRRWMSYLLAHARPMPRSVLARAELVLGADNHWTMLGNFALFLLAGVALLALWLEASTLAAWRHPWGVIGPVVGMMCALLSPMLNRPAALHARRRELALLMLVPGMPRGAALNQQLARRLMLQYLASWLLACLGLLPLVWGMAGSTPVLIFILTLAPSGLMLWRDWSCLNPPSPHGQLLWTLGMLLPGLLTLLALQWLPAPWVGLSLLLAALSWGSWRWRALAFYPAAFPVGRRAGFKPPSPAPATR